MYVMEVTIIVAGICLLGAMLAVDRRHRRALEGTIATQKHTENLTALQRVDEHGARAWAHTRAAEVQATNMTNHEQAPDEEEIPEDQFSGLIIDQTNRHATFEE